MKRQGIAKKTPKIVKIGTKLYHISDFIGSGTYSKVFVATVVTKDDESGLVACKIINKKKAGPDFINKFLPRELNIVQKISHPHIVKVFDVVDLPNTIYVFMQHCSNGDLLEYIRKKGALGEFRAKFMFKQIVSAVHYLHSLDIAHRDLKCENIFLTGKNNVKIGDFGFARLCLTDMSGQPVLSNTFCGSAAYAAPEILEGVAYDPKMYDVWSLGCILYILLSSRMPFDDSNIRKMLRYQHDRAIGASIEMHLKVASSAKRLLLHLLEPDVKRRPNINSVSHSSWLSTRSNKN